MESLPINATSITGWVAKYRQPLCIADVRESPWSRIYYPLDYDLEMRSELAVPLIGANGRLEGVINLESPQVAAFSEEDSHLLQALATQAVIAIQEARLLDALQELAWRLLTDPAPRFFQRLVTLARELLNVAAAAIWTLEGETLEDVARKFGVPVPTLQALNNLPPDHPLPPGQLVFVPGTPPALEAGAPQVRIVEVLGVGLLEQERVRLTNVSPQPVSLEGWSVVDEEGNTFRFPPVVLYAQGSLFLWTKPGVNTAVDVYWGLDTAVWERGETVVLRNAQGEEVHRFEIP